MWSSSWETWCPDTRNGLAILGWLGLSKPLCWQNLLVVEEWGIYMLHLISESFWKKVQKLTLKWNHWYIFFPFWRADDSLMDWKYLWGVFPELGSFCSGSRLAAALNLSVRYLQENCPYVVRNQWVVQQEVPSSTCLWTTAPESGWRFSLEC